MFKLLIVACLILHSYCAEDIVNVYVTQIIDIKTHLPKINNEVFFINNLTTGISTYDFYVELNVTHYYVQFYGKNMEPLLHEDEKSNNKCIVYLNQTIEPGQSGYFRAEIIYMRHIKLYYKQKRLRDNQILLYRGNIHYYSPYLTRVMKVDIIAWKESILRMLIKNTTEIIDPSISSDSNQLFIFKNLSPFSINTIEVKLKNNNPIYVVNLKRTIDVSHFGVITITDSVSIRNEGTKLVGPCELHPFRLRDWLYTHLPTSASSIKLFDDLGLKYNMKIFEQPKHKTLQFDARYSLLGGWKSKYVIQYVVPSYEYVNINRAKNLCSLTVRIIDHVLNDCIIESALVKIMLPQGASANFGPAPNGFVKLQEKQSVTALCFSTRPTVILEGKMLLENHITDYHIYYTYNFMYVFLPAFLLTSYVFLIFLLFFTVRKLLQMTISSNNSNEFCCN